MAADTRSVEALVAAVDRLQPCDHLCIISHTQREKLAAVVPFLRRGLERREQCVYIADEDSRPGILGALKSGGIDVGAPTATGSLAILGAEDTYRRNGPFEPE